MNSTMKHWASAIAWTFACLAAGGCGRQDDHISSADPSLTDAQTIAQARLSSEGAPARNEERTAMLDESGSRYGERPERAPETASPPPEASSGSSGGAGASEASSGNNAGSAPPPTDAALASRVHNTLMADSDLKRMGIDVKVEHGDVTLSGVVNNQVQIDRAVKLTRGVEGVTAIRNAISIRRS